jgi:hypothetical protein
MNTELPKISELYNAENIEETFRADQLNLLLNQEPNFKWIRENKYANNAKYIPIGIIETLLQRIFKQYRVEVLREGQMFNSVYCTIRLHYLHPVTGQWEYHDGVGASQIQTKAGASPAELQSINNNAVQMALPLSKSMAIKDAADHLGKLFGRDLNRKAVMDYTLDANLQIESSNEKLLESIKEMFLEKTDVIPANLYAEIEKVVIEKDESRYTKTLNFLTGL